MTAPGTGRTVAAACATVLADVLSMGLPDPASITFLPDLRVFNCEFSYALDGRDAVHAWAERFGTQVKTRTTSAARSDQDYVLADFIFSDVTFHAYGFFDKT